jgi:hypothetical protein
VRAEGLILYEKSFNIKSSCNEVYYTNYLILPIKMMLCSKLHWQKLFKLKLFSYKIEGGARSLYLAEQRRARARERERGSEREREREKERERERERGRVCGALSCSTPPVSD